MNRSNMNLCECGHDKFEHVMRPNFTSGACSKNQKYCDCWEYKVRKIERNDYAIDWGVKS
jgi:hypothetical protein